LHIIVRLISNAIFTARVSSFAKFVAKNARCLLGCIFNEQLISSLNKKLLRFSDQLQEIRKVTLGSLICANMEQIYSVQPEAFIRNDPYL
jgi:hypothetical protein